MSSDTNEWLIAHDAMVTVLDAKLANLPEWTAFRAIERPLLASLIKAATAVETLAVPVRVPVVKTLSRRERTRISANGSPIPYMTLADKALDAAGKPVTTAALMEYIGAHRPLGDDPKKARIVVQSSLSKDERFRSIAWEGGRAWWYADRPIPKKETAGLFPPPQISNPVGGAH